MRPHLILLLVVLAPLGAATAGAYVHHGLLVAEDLPILAGPVWSGSMVYLWTAVEGESYEASLVPDNAADAFYMEAYHSSDWTCGDSCPEWILNAANCGHPHSVVSPSGGPNSFSFTATQGGTYFLQLNSVNTVGPGPWGYTFTFARTDGTSPDDIHPNANGPGEGLPFGPACGFVDGTLV